MRLLLAAYGGKSGLRCACLNVDGMTIAKLKFLKNEIYTNGYKIIYLQELVKQHGGNKIDINWKDELNDFEFVSDNGIETGFLIHKEVQFNPIKIKKPVGGNLWVTWIVIHRGSAKIICGSLYRSPSRRKSNFNNYPHLASISDIENEMKQIIKEQKCNEIMLAGDFNLKSKIWDIRYNGKEDKYVENLNEFMEKYNLCCINDAERATHCRYEIIDGIPIITSYNSLDLVLVTNSMIKQCTDFNTNTQNVYDGSDSGIDVINSELDLVWITSVSDHFLLSWNINNQNRENVKLKETWRLNSDKWDEYRISLMIGMERICVFIGQNMMKYANKMENFIDILTEKLTKQIRVSAKVTIGRKKFDERSKPWMNKELKDLIKLCKKYRRKKKKLIKKGKKTTMKCKMVVKQLNYYVKLKNKLLTTSQKHWWYKVGKGINDSVNDSKKLYQTYNSLAERHKDLPPMKKADGSFTDDTIEKAEKMHEYFTRNFEESHYSDDIKNYHKKIDEMVENCDLNVDLNLDKNFKFLYILNRKIKEQEIWRAVKVLKRKNAMGCDQIHNVMIIEGINELIPILLILFNLMLKYGKHPFLWKLSECNGMGKPGKDASIVKNIRNLQLTPTLSRIFERIMVWRMLSYFKLNKLFKANNIAYQGNKSIADAFLCLDEDIAEVLEDKSWIHKLDMDLHAAFDTVPLKQLIYNLRCKYGIKNEFLKWIMSFLFNRYNRVKYRDYYTEWKLHNIGVPQGGPMSAVLFVIYMNDFDSIHGDVIFALKYADDASLWNYRTDSDLNRKMQIEINHFSVYCDIKRLWNNYVKTKAMCITRKRKKIEMNYEIQKGDSKIKIDEITKHGKVNNQRMLGLYVKCNGTWNHSIDVFNGKCIAKFEKIRKESSFGHLRLNSLSTWRLGGDTINQIVRFGAECTSRNETNFKKLYTWTNKLARYSISALPSTPNEYLEYELDYDSMEMTVQQILVKTLETARRAPDNTLKSMVFSKWYDYRGEKTYDDMWCAFGNGRNDTHNNTVLSRAAKIKRTIEGINRQNWYEIKKSKIIEERHAIPIYIVQYPNNLLVYYNFYEIYDSINNNDSFNWYTDGSVEKNYGGYGVVTLQDRTNNKMISHSAWIDHYTNIDYCEICAILQALKITCNDNDICKNKDIKYITILTDSKCCIYNSDMKYYCKYEYYYHIVQGIFILCQHLAKYGKTIRIVKIPAHKGITGNELADYWAKHGMKMAKYMDKDGTISNNYIPLIIQNEINNTKIKKKFKKKRDENRMEKRKEAKLNNELRVNSNLYTNVLKSGSKYVKREKAFLWHSETGIITRLRSEHIKLNLYKSAIYGDCDGYCDYCYDEDEKFYETVRHYLIDCPKYTKQRAKLREELIKINDCFGDNKKFNARRLLFPHWYQKQPGKLDKLYERVNILKLVCQYVSGTQRFKDDDKNSVYNMYELELNDKLSKNMDEMMNMVERIKKKYNDEYDERMTMEERNFKSKMDFYLGCDDVDDEEHVNDPNFFGFLDEF